MEKKESDFIVFAVLNIHKNSANNQNLISLVSKTQTPGIIKKQKPELSRTDTYLSVSVYNKNILLDSIAIDHPLYKHLEYITADHTFATKDTILDQAEFFIRFQSRGNLNELRITETINHQPGKDQTIIKLYWHETLLDSYIDFHFQPE